MWNLDRISVHLYAGQINSIRVHRTKHKTEKHFGNYTNTRL